MEKLSQQQNALRMSRRGTPLIFMLLMGSILIIIYLRMRSPSNIDAICSGDCHSLLSVDDVGVVRVQPAYIPFRISDRLLRSPVNNTVAHFSDQRSKQNIPCKFHAAQMAFFTREQSSMKLYGKYPMTGNLLLQMRHDAMIGLPGGGIRFGESIENGMKRELREEMDVQIENDYLYLMSYHNPANVYCGHLFAKEVSWKTLRELGQHAFNNQDTGFENTGYLFMPTLNEIADHPGYHGLPTFLAQAITPGAPATLVGNTLQQILYVLTESTNPPILSRDHMRVGISRACALVARTFCQARSRGKDTGATLSNFFQ